MTDLLPQNATAQERALANAAGRLGAVPAPIRDVWNPDTCPPSLLAWLAWAFSVDQWDDAWTDAQKRAVIRASVGVHRHKGTIGAVREGLAALGIKAQVMEAHNQTPPGPPHTFRILLEADQAGVSQEATQLLFDVIERTKNLRSHMTEAALSVRSVANPRVAVVAGVGHDICLANYVWAPLVINEMAIVI